MIGPTHVFPDWYWTPGKQREAILRRRLYKRLHENINPYPQATSIEIHSKGGWIRSQIWIGVDIEGKPQWWVRFWKDDSTFNGVHLRWEFDPHRNGPLRFEGYGIDDIVFHMEDGYLRANPLDKTILISDHLFEPATFEINLIELETDILRIQSIPPDELEYP